VSLFNVGSRALYWGLVTLSYVLGFVFAYRQMRHWGVFSRLRGKPAGATAIALVWLSLGGLMALPWHQLSSIIGRWVELWTWRGSEAVSTALPTVWGSAPSWVYTVFDTLMMLGVYGWVLWQVSAVLNALAPRIPFARTWKHMAMLDSWAALLTIAALVYGTVGWLQQVILYPPLRPKALSSDVGGYVVGWVVVVAVFGLLVRFLRGYGCRPGPKTSQEL